MTQVPSLEQLQDLCLTIQPNLQTRQAQAHSLLLWGQEAHPVQIQRKHSQTLSVCKAG